MEASCWKVKAALFPMRYYCVYLDSKVCRFQPESETSEPGARKKPAVSWSSQVEFIQMPSFGSSRSALDTVKSTSPSALQEDLQHWLSGCLPFKVDIWLSWALNLLMADAFLSSTSAST